MAKNRFKIPQELFVNEISPNHCIYTLEPLEQGYGHTLGNSLRRVLISSLEGYAVTNLRLPDGCKHEFDAIPGVKESLIDIILNLKKIRFKSVKDKDRAKVHFFIKNKEGAITVADILSKNDDFEVANPELVICHVESIAKFELEFFVEKGLGYAPAHEVKTETQLIGIIPIDAIFSPIVDVKYTVEETLAEGRVDYEKVMLEIKTDGSITPQNALQEAGRRLVEHFELVVDRQIIPQKEGYEDDMLDEKTIDLIKKLKKPLRDFNLLSQRALNSLKAQDIYTLGQLVSRTVPELIKYRNFGKGCIKEVNALIEEQGLSLGMDLSAYKLAEDELL
jgi:DNA-directed RNA polymerase subunit alpha